MNEDAWAGTTALVTGATGFLGGHLAAVLHRRGWRVRALARQSSDLRRLAELGVEIVRGDLGDPGSLRDAAKGARFVFHSAGKVSDWGPREEFVQGNVEGTRNVLAACQESGVERLVHVSSLTVLGLPRTAQLVDEQSPYAVNPPDYYTQTKLEGERLAREAHGQRGLATTVVRPGVIWGRGDTTIIPRFARLLRRGMLVYVDRGANVLGLSHVENLAHGLILAAQTQAAAGQVYHVLDGGPITAREALGQLAEALGTPPPRISLPFAAIHGIASAMELAARVVRRKTPPPLTRYGVRLVACDCRYDTRKAERELGYRPLLDFRAGIAEVAAEVREGLAA